jgi:hypothetical protein
LTTIVQLLGAWRTALAPDAFQELLPAQRHPRFGGEGVEQVELGPAQLDRRIADRDLAGAGVDAQRPELADRCRFAGHPRPSLHRPDAGHELPGGVGLGDVVVGADREPDDAVGLAVETGQHDHVGVAEGAQAATGLDPVDAGQVDVQHHQVGGICPRQLQGALRVGTDGDLEGLALEQPRGRGGELRVVLDDQHLQRFRPVS